MRALAALCCLLPAVAALAQAKLPIEFDADPGFKPLPTYLGNPTPDPTIEVRDGVATLSVKEAGKGMKFELPVQPFDSGAHTYLVFRYKAIALAGGYAFHVLDDSQAGVMALDTNELQRDGQWHVTALDLAARGVSGRVHGLISEVECAGEPASISFDYIRVSDEAPPDATIIPALPPEEKPFVIRGSELSGLVHHDGWLASPARTIAAVVEGGVLHLSAADGPGHGMKWSQALNPPLDTEPYRYVSIRYKARNIEKHGDYFVWLGSEAGGLAQKSASLATMSDLQDDGKWHVAIAPLEKRFKAVEIAVQVSSSALRGEAWIESISFLSRKPLRTPEDLISIARNWGASSLDAGKLHTVDLHSVANASGKSRARGLGLSRWIEPGKITAQGVPFELIAATKDLVATSDDIDETVAIPVGATATEAYVLMAAKLPGQDLSGMLGSRPLRGFNNPERFVFEVRYADGVTDEMLPICLSSNAHEIAGGLDVYCLPNLRKAPVKSIGLRNRMEGGTLMVAGVTLNSAPSNRKTSDEFALPPQPTPRLGAQPEISLHVAPTAGGYEVENDSMALSLQTEGGISVRGIASHSLGPHDVKVQPGPLFELGIGRDLVTSDKVTTGEAQVTREADGVALTVPFDARPTGAPFTGALHAKACREGDILMSLDVTYTGDRPAAPIVNFPTLSGLRVGRAEDTWYLHAMKGGMINRVPTVQRHYYGGEHPLQVEDIFNPGLGGGLALLTYDLRDIYKAWCMAKDATGVGWRIEYWPREYQPGEKIDVAPTALRAHGGDWREALALYRQWTATWYKPQVPRKKWFQECFNYRQHLAWVDLRDQKTGKWRIDEVIKEDREFFGRLDYLHIFDFGESRVYGRVGDYNHYEELGGREAMAAAIKQAEDLGVPVGLYIEGYLCDERGVWAKSRGAAVPAASGATAPATNVSANDIRQQDGKPLMWPDSTEHMMCPASEGWRTHQAETYQRVAGELHPSGMYIDQFGFVDAGKTCWSREHGHPVPWPPITGERGTLKAIRTSTPPEIATLTEETPNDVNSQYQDGALCYSVAFNNPALAPHRVNLFRFQFPSFKVFQLTAYNPFVEGGWDLLKYPFFNGDGYWLGNDIPGGFSRDARDFLRKVFAVQHEHRAAFTSDDVEALVPTLRPTVYANRFTGGGETVWTLLNGEYTTFRGDVLRVPHQAGTVYLDAWTGRGIEAKVAGGFATIPVVLGPQGVGCVVGRRG